VSEPNEPKVEVLGVDEQAEFRKGMQAIRENIKANEYATKERAAQAAQAAMYGLGERLYFLVEREPSREGQPDRWRGTCITGLPRPDLSLVVRGTSPDDVIFEARHGYLQLLVQAQVERSSKAASERACKAHYEIADIRGLG
jgi:hypothetical protein